MAWEESQKHLLGLSYHDLQSLCKQYNLPANKSHSQLAGSLASFLEKGSINSASERKAQASLIASPSLLSNIKEASTRCQDNHKRVPYSVRDDGDRPLLHVKHHKGPQTPMDETLESDTGTRMGFPPVSTKSGEADCFRHSSSVQGISSYVQLQIADGIEKNSTAQGHAIQLDSTVKADGEIYPESSFLAPNVCDNITDAGSGSSDKIVKNKKSSFQFFVMSDEGIDLFVDLNSTPSTLIESMKEEIFIPSSTYCSEPGNFSHSISSLVTKDDSHSSISPSGNIFVEIQNRAAPFTSSSLGSTGGGYSHSKPYLPDATAVNSMSSASTFPGTSLEISGSQEGVPVVSSSCLTSDVQNISHMTANASNNEMLPQESVEMLPQESVEMLPQESVDMLPQESVEMLPQESVEFSMCPERNHAPLIDVSIHPTGNKDSINPVKVGCTQNIQVADTDRAAAFSSGDVVRSDSGENSCPTFKEKHEMIKVLAGAQLIHNVNTHEVTLENEPVEAMPVKEDIVCHDRLSISCQLAGQTVAKLPVTDAQSEASSADCCIAGSSKLINTTPSPAASDNAFSPKHGAESAQSHDSVDKKVCDPDELELESKTQPSAAPPRNILLSLRSASARQTKLATLPRRSARLVPK